MPQTWYAIHVKPRTEKKLQSLLLAWRVWNVLPSYVKVRKVQRRTVKTEIPMFPGYVLARLGEGDRLRVLRTNLAVAMSPIDRPLPVLRRLHGLVKAAQDADSFRLVPPTESGDFVHIVKGPMKGLEGRVKVVDGKALLTVNVEAFGGAVEVQVSPSDCVPA